jgi:hypothetical protein
VDVINNQLIFIKKESMKTITNFLEKYGLTIILCLTVLSTCSTSMNRKRSEKKILNELDSLKTEVFVLKKELKKELKVEGLKAEKRMIQSTDRKILDVNRQAEIDKELQQLEKQ